MNANRAAGLIAVVVFVIATGIATVHAGSPTGPVYQAQKRVTDAESQLRKAKAALRRSGDKIRGQIEATPEYKQAAAAARTAQGKYNSAVKAAKKSLAQAPEYQQALHERDQRQNERDALRGRTDATPEQRTRAAVELLKAQQGVARIEQKAIDSDPAVTQAAEDLAQANAKLAELQSTFPQYALKDPAYQSAQQQVA